ncbi:DNA-binding transcriptional LysR family regulator [Mitsuaria sp. BK045]|uniref:LysR substrate-binding domain-containing protein n=1 Tax=unclassified Roseateles TaxID=2626991 RepID=UPI00161F8F58|nr:MULTISPECIES: LysR substrate-binding domain-containing protein [unclassified Roseateles]MBB3294618.1 DNA-binding transcriptional LysR family regulator [Mitsuaria sp. BK041]MBB3363834.1 DNA-binding transcriptional LysR family regulator [Mitsuaria sp. BK045]
MNLHRVDLVSLSLFALVARTGSISRGAALAALAVGAASKRLSDLEHALGTTLLERHSRGVSLTEAGLALQRHAQRILSDVDQMTADLSDYASGLTGVVRLWANTSAVTQFLPAQVSGFVRDNPRIRIELEEADSHEIVVAVLDGRADLGIFADRTPALGLHVLNYRQDRLVLVAPAGHPLSRRKAVRWVQAVEYDFVTLAKATSLHKRLEMETETLGRRLKNRIQVRSFDAMCRMVAAGMGIAVLPDVAVEPLLKPLDLRRVALDEPWSDRRLLIGVRDLDGLPRHVRVFIDHLCS